MYLYYICRELVYFLCFSANGALMRRDTQYVGTKEQFQDHFLSSVKQRANEACEVMC